MHADTELHISEFGTFNLSVIEGNSCEEQLIVVCNNLKYTSTVLLLTSY